jgi:hypothetical protein
VVALDEQHLQQRLALRVEFVGVAPPSSPSRRMHGARRPGAAVDLHQCRRGTSRAAQSRDASTGAGCSGRRGWRPAGWSRRARRARPSPSSVKVRFAGVNRVWSVMPGLQVRAGSSRPVMRARDRQLGIEVEAGLEVQRLQALLVGRAELGDGVAQRVAGGGAQPQCVAACISLSSSNSTSTSWREPWPAASLSMRRTPAPCRRGRACRSRSSRGRRSARSCAPPRTCRASGRTP